MSLRVAGARDCGPCQKVSKMWGFCDISKNDSRRDVGHLKRIWKDAFSVAGVVQETCSSELLGGPGADLGVAFWSLRFSGLLRWFCVTGAARRMTWDHFFRGRRITSDRWTGKIAKRIGTRQSALHSTFHFWRTSHRIVSFLMFSIRKMKKSCRIASFLTLLSSKIEEVSQNCFVFDVVNFENEEVSQNCFVVDVVKFKHRGSLAELLRFWCCQVQNLRTSRRIASFSSLQIDRQTDR